MNPKNKWTAKKIRAILRRWQRVWLLSNREVIYPLALFTDRGFNKLTTVSTLKDRISFWNRQNKLPEEDRDVNMTPAMLELLSFHQAVSDYQEQLIQGAMFEKDRKNVTGLIFLAKTKHGYKETQKIEVSRDVNLDEIINRAEKKSADGVSE